jgi:hypothetical protein
MADVFRFISTRGKSHALPIREDEIEKGAWYTTLCNRMVTATGNEKPVEFLHTIHCETCRNRMSQMLENLEKK